MKLLFAALLAGSVCAVSLAWQQTPPIFRGRLDLVQLDVSVFDKDGRPIAGLTAGDFTLLEDDKPRPIQGFVAVAPPESAPPTAAWLRDATEDVVTNDLRDRQLLVLLIDDASFGNFCTVSESSHAQDAIVARAKQIANAFVNSLRPSDLAAVIFTGDNRRSQDFTGDHARLLTAVNRTWGPTVPAELTRKYAVSVLLRAIESLKGLPGRRKAVVDISACIGLGGPYAETLTDYIYQAAQDENVNVYTIWPGSRTNEDTWLNRIARQTGGFEVAAGDKPAAIEAAVARVLEANRWYLVLGYASADPAKFHHRRVTVARAGAVVQTRDTYYWPLKETPAPVLPPGAATAIAGILPASDLPMRVSVAPVATSAGAALAVIAAVRPPLSPVGSSESANDIVELHAALFTPEGASRGATSQSVERARAGGRQSPEYEILAQLAAPKAGMYEVRLGAHGQAANVDGSVYFTVEVPDFRSVPVSLSGVFIASSSTPPSGPVGALATLLPVVPTTVREFARADHASAFVRLYEGGGGAIVPAALQVRIVDDHAGAVYDRTEAVPASRFGPSRGADCTFALPTATLASGAYLLTFEARVRDAKATRDVRFSVR